MYSSNDLTIIVAIIALIASIVSSFVTAIFNRKNEDFKRKQETDLKRLEIENQEKIKKMEHENQQKIDHLRHELEIRKIEKDARLDYEYESRKRLYQDFEPLLFLLIECSDSAQFRIQELAKYAKMGKLNENNGWLSYPSYFMISTIYKLLLPISIFKLIQQQLTQYDLELIPLFKVQYLLTKALYLTFASDFDLAQSNPKFDYDPDFNSKLENIDKYPGKFKKQGIYINELEIILESLIVKDPIGHTRLMSFGEFKKRFFQTSISKEMIVLEPYNEIICLFQNFHPKTRPVLWRILLSQYYIYKAIKFSREIKPENIENFKVIKHLPLQERKLFDWRESNEANDIDVLINPFDAIELYLEKSEIGMFIGTKTIENDIHQPYVSMSIGSPIKIN
jgi:hypothetical protein